jgi:outer membrane lipoprotein SlyB
MKTHCRARRPVKSMLLLVCVGFGLSACAGADYRPVVDMAGHSNAQYNRDLALCQYQARSVRNNANEAEDAGLGAVGGAAGGAVLGAVGGAAGIGAGVGALAGFVGVGAYKEAQTENREEQIVKNCMRMHDFTILG